LPIWQLSRQTRTENGAQRGRNSAGLLPNLAVGEANHPVTEGVKLNVTCSVRFEGDAIAVMPEAVGLDDQRLLAPEEVDLVRPNPNIHFRAGETVAAAEAKEVPLQLAAGEVGLSLERGFIDQSQVECAADGLPVKGAWRDAAEVSERSRGTGDGDGVAAGRQTGNEGGGPVDGDAGAALPAAVRREGDVDRSLAHRKHSPQRCSASMAHRGSLTEGESGYHTPAFEAEAPVPERVDAAMKAV
jgi:hypothetical protein